jgi:hypothetical protein
VTCKRALSIWTLLGSSVISDVDYLHLWTLRVVEKVMIQELATPESGGPHAQPCLKSEARQGRRPRRGGKDHDVRTGKIHIIVVRQECDISVGHLYKWALRVVERCVLSAAPG